MSIVDYSIIQIYQCYCVYIYIHTHILYHSCPFLINHVLSHDTTIIYIYMLIFPCWALRTGVPGGGTGVPLASAVEWRTFGPFIDDEHKDFPFEKMHKG